MAINDFYHVIKPEITQMAMTFLYLQYTRGTDTAIWRRSWSNTSPLIERPGINWKCPYILLSLATFFPVFFQNYCSGQIITLYFPGWPLQLGLWCSNQDSTVLWAEHFTGSQETWFLSWTVHVFVFAHHSISPGFCPRPSHLHLNKIRIIPEKQSLTIRSVDVAKTTGS